MTETKEEIKLEEKFDPVEFYFDGLLKDLESIIVGNELTISNILSTCVNLMKLVEQRENIHGEQKKELILKVLKAYVLNHKGDETLLNILPYFIEVALLLDTKKLKIKAEEVIEEASKCCTSFCSIFKKNKKGEKR
jgi:hypothetical protein